MSDAGRNIPTELARQQALLRALWRQGELPEALAGLAAAPGGQGAGLAAGLEVYRANAGAHAERALASACPTLAALIGEEALAGLARALWQACPPARGDLAAFALAAPGFIDEDPQLAAWPYLADVARLDLAVQALERAADGPAQPAGLARLAECDPAALWLRARPGLTLQRSRWPIASIWQAHQGPDVAVALATLDLDQPEAALVWRDGWRGAVARLDEPQAAFTEAVLGGASLGAALEAAPPDLDFTAWLTQALQQQWFIAVEGAAPAGMNEEMPR